MAAAVNDIQNLLILGIGTYSSHPPLSGQRATQVQALLVLKDLLLSSAFLYPSFAEGSPACKRQDSNDNSLITLM